MPLRRGLTGVMKVTSAMADIARPPGSGLVVLAYHRVGQHTHVSVDLPLTLFADQMAYLASQYQPATIDHGLDLLALEHAGATTGKPAIVVSFDDGTADFSEEAIGVLVATGVPVVVYVATRHVDEGIPFPDGGRPISWSGLADALSTGLVTIGSHTHSHRLLDRVDGQVAAEELDRSVGLIGDRLGVSCHHFAYPKALCGSPSAEVEVRQRFRSAALSGCRVNPWANTDPHRLARAPIQTADGMRWFRRKAAGGMRFEDDVRTLLNRRRYRVATS